MLSRIEGSVLRAYGRGRDSVVGHREQGERERGRERGICFFCDEKMFLCFLVCVLHELYFVVMRSIVIIMRCASGSELPVYSWW